MPTSPVCRHDLQKPPDDLGEWFGCEQCGVPLKVPSALATVLFGISTTVLLVAFWRLPLLSQRYFRELHFPGYLMLGFVTTIYGFLARLVWKTRLAQPRLHDPYSSLNLSDEVRNSGEEVEIPAQRGPVPAGEVAALIRSEQK